MAVASPFSYRKSQFQKGYPLLGSHLLQRTPLKRKIAEFKAVIFALFMSNAVVLTSNNAEFENYLSDTFKLKKNSEVCLAKAAISVPVEIHQFVTIPYGSSGV